MATRTRVNLRDGEYAKLRAHLLSNGSLFEEAAFGFATTRMADDKLTFDVIELLPVPPEGFVERSEDFLQLTDEMRGRVIKRAHDLGASLIEFHSHPSQSTAQFSPSDCSGFGEFVPHVRWRLKKRPYAAFVFAPRNFDALAWSGDGDRPEAVEGILADGQLLTPTGRSFKNWGRTYGF
jgi:hypothetical protein